MTMQDHATLKEIKDLAKNKHSNTVRRIFV